MTQNLFTGYTEQRKRALLEKIAAHEQLRADVREISVPRLGETRALLRDKGDDPWVIEGYAALFSQPTEMLWWREEIAPGAFSRAVGEDDVRCLINHDANLVLARNKATPVPTLEIKEDEKGLWYRAVLDPEITYARNLWLSIDRGDISQSSFAFIPKRVEWVMGEDPDDDLRRILEVKLYDVAPVTYPAYQTTSVGTRSVLFQAVQELMQLREERAQRPQAAAPQADLTDYFATRRRELEVLLRKEGK